MSTTHTEIAWTDATWNPVRGCSVVSPGCSACYAMKLAHRFSGEGKPYFGLTEIGPKGPRWTGKVECVESALDQPLRWRKPRRIFVNSMSDLFHEGVPDAFIDRVFAVMALAPRHTFQVLTKRAARMGAYVSAVVADRKRFTNWAAQGSRWMGTVDLKHRRAEVPPQWPLPNVWLGVSVENQHFADERIPRLLHTPAAVRFISAEPLLGPVNLRGWCNPGWVCSRCHEFQSNDHEACRQCGNTNPFNDMIGRLDWVIVGGESGPQSRPFDLAWARSIVQQCQAAGVPVFVKQLGTVPVVAEEDWRSADPVALLNARNHRRCSPHDVPLKFFNRKGGDPSEWPEDLRVRQWPEARP